MNVTTASPAEIDRQLARLGAEGNGIRDRIDGYRANLHRAVDERADRFGRYPTRTLDEIVERLTTMVTDPEADDVAPRHMDSVKRALAEIPGLREDLAEITGQERILDAEYRRRGCWTRAFECINTDGHIHSSRNCSSLRPTTLLRWVIDAEVDGKDVEISGITQAQIIELAGEGACTICYPDAPVNTRKQTNRLTDPVVLAARAERAKELAKKRAEKEAKAITNPDGSPLRVNRETLATEVSAERYAVDMLFNNRWYGHGFEGTEEADFEQILRALAAKRETHVDTQRICVQLKADKKFARESRR